MIRLTDYDDGKGKYQSHEVLLVYDDGDDVNFSTILGYGETYEEGLQNFKNQFEEKFKELEEFREKLLNGNIEKPLEIDCCGKVLRDANDEEK